VEVLRRSAILNLATDEKQLGQTSARKPMMTVSIDPEGTVLVAGRSQK